MKKWIAFFILLLVASSSIGQIQGRQATPNIVFIFADDLGYSDLSCFGAGGIHTPNIDRIAAEGIKFTDFYSASSVCSPSRAGLLTGRYPQRMGINGVFFPESFTGMPPEEITIAELLKAKGYVSGIVGKWHLGHRHQFLPLQQGFDSYFGIPYSNDMESIVYMRGNDVETFAVDQTQLTKTYTREALQFIEKHQDQPFFLYVAHNMPHVPLYVSEDFAGTSPRGLYGDVVQELDWSVGQILQKLEALDLLENTLVIFSSDNGPWLVMEDHGGSAHPLREGKQYTFDGGMRVPTVAMWKGNISAGRIHSELATQMDWFPTFAKLTGIPLPAGRPIDGRDLSAVLFNTGQREAHPFLFFDGSDLQGYRRGDWKIKKPYEGFAGANWKKAVAAHDTLLINLKEDPGERHNQYANHGDLARLLFREMDEAYLDLGQLPPSQVLRTTADKSHYEAIDKKKNTFVEIDGSRLNYVVQGQGTPCLVIGSSVYYPKTFSQDLRKHLQMYFVDLKWFARAYNPENLDAITIQSIVDDVEAIRRQLGLEKPIIMGHSIHGTIAMEYAKRHPDKISAVIAIGSPSVFGNKIYDEKAAALWATASEKRKAIQQRNWGNTTELDRLTGKEATAAEYNQASPQYWYDPNYDANWLWDGMTVHTQVTNNLFQRVFSNYDMFDGNWKIPVPAYVAMGKYDYVIPYTLWQPAYRQIPDFTLVLFDMSGHTPQLEEPAAFDRELLNWLKQHHLAN